MYVPYARQYCFFEKKMIFIIRFLIIIIFFILIYSCITDILHRTIKNYCVLLILICSCVLALYFSHVNIFLPILVLVLGFIMTIVGVIGAGDIKLIIALLIGMPQDDIAVFFFVMGCIGSPLAILTTLFCKYALKKNDNTIPFGIAITLGYFAAMWRFL